MKEILTAQALIPQIDHVIETVNLPRYMALTCDIEPDYGNRTGTLELLEDTKYVTELLRWCDEKKIPLSGFAVTNLFGKSLAGMKVLIESGTELHAHSHTHDTKTYANQSSEEILKSQDAFTKARGVPAKGYRAPQGMLYPNDIQALSDAGFSFSSSIFPAKRLNSFDLRTMPRDPWIWDSGITELPFGVSAQRKMVTVSYLKLFGKRFWKKQIEDELPRMLVIDSHLHDFFLPSSAKDLPLLFRVLYRRNGQLGFSLLSWLLEHLQEKGYQPITMTKMAEIVAGTH